MLKSFLRSKYTKTVIEHFEKPKNVGSFTPLHI